MAQLTAIPVAAGTGREVMGQQQRRACTMSWRGKDAAPPVPQTWEMPREVGALSSLGTEPLDPQPLIPDTRMCQRTELVWRPKSVNKTGLAGGHNRKKKALPKETRKSRGEEACKAMGEARGRWGGGEVGAQTGTQEGGTGGGGRAE